jgi:hypothetical protein
MSALKGQIFLVHRIALFAEIAQNALYITLQAPASENCWVKIAISGFSLQRLRKEIVDRLLISLKKVNPLLQSVYKFEHDRFVPDERLVAD